MKQEISTGINAPVRSARKSQTSEAVIESASTLPRTFVQSAEPIGVMKRRVAYRFRKMSFYAVDCLYKSRDKLKPLFIARYADDGSRLLIHPKTGRVMSILTPDNTNIAVGNKLVTEFVPGDPEKVKAVRYIFETNWRYSYGQKGASNKVAAHLNEMGIIGPHGHRWTGRLVRKVSNRPIYLGYTLHFPFRRTDLNSSRLAERGPRWLAVEHPNLKNAFMDEAKRQRIWSLMKDKLNSGVIPKA